jgi:hypothetical protein
VNKLSTRSPRSRILAVVLAVVMAASLFAMSASASGPSDPDYTQSAYLWWFGQPGSANYPKFQPTPMGDTAIIGYDKIDDDTTEFYFQATTIMGIKGYIDSIIIDGTEYYEPNDPLDPVAGGYAYLPTPYDSVNPGYMLQIDYLHITLIGSTHPVELYNIWLEVDFTPSV